MEYYVDAEGNYLGGYMGAAALATLPPGAVRVPLPPPNVADTWVNGAWVINQAALGQESYNTAIVSGLTIDSTVTPSLDGIYACDSAGAR